MAKISKYKTLWLLLLFFLAGIIVLLLFVPNLFDKKKTLIVGYIMPGAVTEEGWNGEHYRAVEQACEERDCKLIVKENVEEMTGECEQAIRELAAEGAQMIILNSYGYSEEVKDVVTQYPDIVFYGTSSECHADNLTSYFARMYQARYLAGIIAGMQTQSGTIGYVAAMSNNEVNRGISAFALGVRRVNPEAEVVVIWTGAWDDAQKETEAVKLLVEKEQIDVVTYHQNQDYVVQEAENCGIASVGYHQYYEGYSGNYMTAAVCDWKLLYQQLIREFQRGKGNARDNYWIGLEESVVGLDGCSELVTEEMLSEVEEAKKEILSGKDVFSGVIYDNEGNLRCGENETISDEMLLEHFDWYTEGVRIYEE
ncbi:MAG: BMP family ABC transporter substrate-binding protein [Lachnospiraceae bacterium]|nr:BMP family ABC transporter substrate-binding protein [Lachnospiraceae bacterium]